ncbi:energy transducer TonB [Hymenobacter tenuis]
MAITLQKDGLSDTITLADYESAYKRGTIPMLCEVMPAYIKRNKKDSLPRFIQENLHWPAIGLRMDIGGKVFVSFVVGIDGNVYHTKILKSLHPDFDAEALRAVQLLSGRFSPAVCGGVARPHEMVVPVSFFLN